MMWIQYIWVLAFWIFAILIFISCLGVLLFKNPVYAALSLLANLCLTAILYLAFLGAPFIAMIQIIVYAGAIMVFFLFVLMLMNLKKGEYSDPIIPWKLLFGFVAVILFALQAFVLKGEWKGRVLPGTHGVGVKAISDTIFTQYILPFELVSILIFVAVLGAVALAKKKL